MYLQTVKPVVRMRVGGLLDCIGLPFSPKNACLHMRMKLLRLVLVLGLFVRPALDDADTLSLRLYYCRLLLLQWLDLAKIHARLFEEVSEFLYSFKA
jgi:hypothetical protein